MENQAIKKYLAIGIMFLFIGASVLPIISGVPQNLILSKNAGKHGKDYPQKTHQQQNGPQKRNDSAIIHAVKQPTIKIEKNTKTTSTQKTVKPLKSKVRHEPNLLSFTSAPKNSGSTGTSEGTLLENDVNPVAIENNNPLSITNKNSNGGPQSLDGPATVDLGTAGDFVILSKSGISTTGTTSIVGDIGVSPIAATAITGFGLVMDSTNQFSTSSLVTGRVYAANYAPPTPSKMTTAVSDMETAYTDAAGRPTPDFTNLGAGNIGGLTLAPGLYKWTTGVTIPTDVTLNGTGGSDDVWIFQISGTLIVSSSTEVILTNGSQPGNIFWQVTGQVTLGSSSVFKGNILTQTAVVMDTGASLEGRALAQTAVTLDANTVTLQALETHRVYNLNTGENFTTIQAAIDAEGTLNGHTLVVSPGTYTENVNVSKSLTIRGNNATSMPVINGMGDRKSVV
jgi:hypothetical protein